MFSKGQKIVCVDDKFHPDTVKLFVAFPKKDAVYTVRAVYIGRGNTRAADSGKMEGEVGVLLAELLNPIDPGLKQGLAGELGFKAERFAEIQPPAEQANKQVDTRPALAPRPSMNPAPAKPQLVPSHD
jgi:hypothetical protein